MEVNGGSKAISKIAMILIMTCVCLIAGCKGKETLSFSALTENEVIQKIQFRDGTNGAFFQTEDKARIQKLEDFLNTKKYQLAKTPEPFTGYLYSGKLNDKTNIGFAGSYFILGVKYYKIIAEDAAFYSSLNQIVESFEASENK